MLSLYSEDRDLALFTVAEIAMPGYTGMLVDMDTSWNGLGYIGPSLRARLGISRRRKGAVVGDAWRAK